MKHFGPTASGMILLGAALFGQAPAQAAGVHSLELNLRYYDFEYEEDLPAPHKSTEQAWVPDLELDYYYQGDSFYGRVIIDYGDAQTDYDGSTWGGVPVQTVTENVFITTEVNFGYTFANDVSPIAFVFYTGAGQRYWERDLQGQGGYAEDYTQRYIPLGLRTLFTIDERWRGALDISARVTVDGDMKAHMGRIGIDDTSVSLGQSTSWKFELPLIYQYNDRWSVAFTPWYEVFNIVKSDWVTATVGGEVVEDENGEVLLLREPSSRTERLGVNLGARYSF